MVFGVHEFDLDPGVQIDSIKQPIKSNCGGSGTMSHGKATSLYNHLDHCFVVFKDIQQRYITIRMHVCGNKINIVQIIDHSLRFLSRLKFEKCCTNQVLSIQCPKRWFLIVLMCETAVCFLHIQLIGTNVWTVPVCIVWQYYPHDNIVCIHMYDEYMKSIDSGVCHKPWSILLWIVRACLLTIKYQVVQFLPNVNISEQCGSILLTILQQISIPLLWNDGHQCMELILRRVGESSCLPTHNIVPHISWHDLPYHKTMKSDENSQGMEAFLFNPRKFSIQTWFCYCQQYLCLFHIVLECNPNIHDQDKMLVLPNRLLYWTFHIWSMFRFFPANFMSSTFTDQNYPFHGIQRDIPNFGFFSQPCFNRIFSNCLSHNNPVKGWPCRFRSRGTTGSSILDHDFGHLCRGGRIQMSGHSDLNFQ